MPNFYVVVADSAIAKLFSVAGKTGELVLVENLVSPDARVHNRELLSDKPGRVFDIKGEGRHSTDSDRSPKQQISIRFASEVADRIERDFREKRFDQLYLIAEPQFLGLLKKSIAHEIENVISESIPKNLTRHDLESIREVLPQRLWSGVIDSWR